MSDKKVTCACGCTDIDPRDAEIARLAAEVERLSTESISQRCHRTRCQCCWICEEPTCGDNQSVLRRERDQARDDYKNACATVAAMHAAAVGEVRGPTIGAVEDVAKVRADLETERLRLTACGVVALADTPESAAKARDMHADYRSASCDDVARRVDECIRLRADLAEAQRVVEACKSVIGELVLEGAYIREATIDHCDPEYRHLILSNRYNKAIDDARAILAGRKP